MTTYPTLVPQSIDFDLGRMNISEQQLLGSGPIRFRHSLRTTGYNLRLVYRALTQAQVESLRDHYNEVDGTYREFDVPASIWGNLNVAATTSLYKYAAPPEEIHTGLHYEVSVTLRVIFGVNLLYDLQGGGANQSTIAATSFTSFAFQGYAPFILNGGAADPDSPAATLILEGKGADR
jgi:hypothetical protein